MKKTIIFIPRSDFLTSDRVMPPLGPLYLKSFVEAHGHYIEVNNEPEVFPIEEIKKFDFVGYSCTTPQSKEAILHCEIVKDAYPEKQTIIGGAHAKYYYAELLKDSPFDFIVSGDGEFALLDIFAGKAKNRLVHPPNMTVSIMNECPIPWRDEKFLGDYHYYIKERRATTAVVGRHCPMSCKFCESRLSGLAYYSPQHVEAEIIDIVYNSGFDAIMYYDDIFVNNRKRVKELCNVIKPHNIYFRCFAHSITFSDEIAETLADAGCKVVCWGAESGHQKILDMVGKGNKVETNYKMAETILKHGMEAVAFCMIGLPGENKETIAATEKFIATFADNPHFSFDYTIYYPYQKTYIRENIHEFDLKLHLDGSIGYYKGKGGKSECCVSTSALSAEDIASERDRICKKYSKTFRGYKAGTKENIECSEKK